MNRRLMLSLAVCVSFSIAHAQAPPPKPDAPPAENKDASAANPSVDQGLLAKKYEQLEATLLRIAQRLDKQPGIENHERAQLIYRALAEAREKRISVNLTQLATLLEKPALKELKQVLESGADVKIDLEAILAMLLSEDSTTKDYEKNLRERIRQLENLIRMQRIAQARNQNPNISPEEAAKAQQKATEEVNRLLAELQKLEGEKKGAGKNEGKTQDPKKQGDREKKDAGKEQDQGENKDKQDQDKKEESKPGQDKQSQGKEGQRKPGQDKQGSEKQGQKDQGEGSKKEGEDKKREGQKDPNESKDPKEKGQKDPNESKDPKEKGQKDPNDPKDPKDPKGQKGQQGDQQKGDNKQQPKGQDQKDPSEPKQQQKPQGEQGEEGDPSDQQQKKQQQQQQEEQQEKTPGRKSIQDANDYQRRAEKKLSEKDRQKAADDQDAAARKLEEAKKQLEEILRQRREEEIERRLADLRRRCEKMLEMQEIVYASTQKIDRKIQESSDKKASREEEVASRDLSERENDIVTEADMAIKILETEGSAVAFPEVFQQVRKDMIQVSNRLGRVDVGVQTRAIEEDIIATLKEMIDALKKAQQDQRDRKEQEKQQQQQQGQPQSGPRSLVDQLAELRMIKSLQLRVNQRTTLWGKSYQGEQAETPEIVTELKDLAQRQMRIYQVTNDLAKGKNQ